MEKAIITKLKKTFEDYAYDENGVEFWLARDLQVLLGYIEWRKFLGVIEKAKEACSKSGNEIKDHFVDAAKKVNLGSGSVREIEDLMLTRYACYLIAQNGGPKERRDCFCTELFCYTDQKTGTNRRKNSTFRKAKGKAEINIF